MAVWGGLEVPFFLFLLAAGKKLSSPSFPGDSSAYGRIFNTGFPLMSFYTEYIVFFFPIHLRYQ